MALLELQAGQTYLLKVAQIINRNKKIPQRGGVMCNGYFVWLEDRCGSSLQVEYLTPKDNADDLVVGVEQYISCKLISSFGVPEIEPGDEPNSRLPKLTKYTDADLTVKKDPASDVNYFAASVGGKAIVFAMGYAKDILLAEIAKQPEGYRVTDEDIDKMFQWGTRITTEMVERIDF